MSGVAWDPVDGETSTVIGVRKVRAPAARRAIDGVVLVYHLQKTIWWYLLRDEVTKAEIKHTLNNTHHDFYTVKSLGKKLLHSQMV